MKDYTNSQIAVLISEHIHNKKHREILLAHFVDGETYETIAERVNLSPRWIGSIISRGAAKLEKYL